MKYTTYAQSLKLIQAGLPSSTADLSFANYSFIEDDNGHIIPGSVKVINEEVRIGNPFNIAPAWSMSCLWELLNGSDVYYYQFGTNMSTDKIMDSLVEAVARAMKTKQIKIHGKTDK